MDILKKAQTYGSFNNWLSNLPEEDLQHISDTLDEASSDDGEVTDQDTMSQVIALTIHFSGSEEVTEEEMGEQLQKLAITCAMELNVRKGDMTKNGLYSLIDGEETATFSITKQGEDRVKNMLKKER